MTSPGRQLEALLAMGQREILLVAPFITYPAFARLLSQIPDTATLCCITRWRPEEIAAGVNDTAIWQLISERSNSQLRILYRLHAKYFRADDRCLVGSANLTNTALGWTNNANLELLIDTNPIPTFEQQLYDKSTAVDQELYEHIRNLTETLQQWQFPSQLTQSTGITPENSHNSLTTHTLDSWLPQLRHPTDLYLAYADRIDDLSAAAQQAASVDLDALNVPPGLPREAFDQYVALLLRQHRLLHRLNAFLATPQPFGAVRDWLRHHGRSTAPARDWQTLMRWLLHFLPAHYQLYPARHSEVFGRRT
jgi:hypothetical protein